MLTVQCLVLFVYLGFSSQSKLFYVYADITNTREGLQMLTFAQHAWTFNIEGLQGEVTTLFNDCRGWNSENYALVANKESTIQ